MNNLVQVSVSGVGDVSDGPLCLPGTLLSLSLQFLFLSFSVAILDHVALVHLTKTKKFELRTNLRLACKNAFNQPLNINLLH